MSGVDVVVYKCVVCGRAFVKKAALRGHLRVHGDLVWENFTVRIPKDLASKFKEVCQKHNTTTCQLISSLVKAVIAGDERGVDVVNIGSPNPVIINVHETFLGKPRSAWKTPLQESCKLWPPSCEFADDFIRSIREVGCTRSKEWTRLEECWGCFQRGGRHR